VDFDISKEKKMISKLLFVHGTGVRKRSYELTAARISSQLERIAPNVTLEPCLWGDTHGATLGLDGASIPRFEGATAPLPSGDQDVALWELLERDPLFEIRELAATRMPDLVPPAEQVRKREFAAKVSALNEDAAIVRLIEGRRLSIEWKRATEMVARSHELAVAIAAASRIGAAMHTAVARAIVAAMLKSLMVENRPTLSRKLRDQIVQQAINSLGGGELGLHDWISSRLVGFAERWVTTKLQRNRDAVFNGAYPFAGDILRYQVRGDQIRRFIEKRIQNCGDEVAIIAHSLGGIACVDLLIERSLPQVKLLVTIGSQAAFLYEIGALASLPFPEPLPDHFPRHWLNFFDRNDLLSYYAANVFKGRAHDLEVTSGQPFPHSHSAYWEEDSLWDRLKPWLQ
jgi:hypothetical protein